jgi:hypothetical protein
MDEIHMASEQFVRKITGFAKPSLKNEVVYNEAINNVALATQKLLNSLETNANPKNREIEKARAHERSSKRFGPREN